MENTSSDYRKSIGDNLGRIIKNKFHKVDDSEVRVCTVVAVYSDILTPETFGTIDVIDDLDGSEYFGVPVNAHINDDGTAGISGKYTFPKIKSAVILKEFGVKGNEQHVPIMFSHVDKLFNQFNEEVTTSVVEVTTADEDNPYDTEETGNKSEISQNALKYDQRVVTENDGYMQLLMHSGYSDGKELFIQNNASNSGSANRTYLRFREQELYARSSHDSGDSSAFELDAEEKRVRIQMDARNTGGTVKSVFLTEDRLYLDTDEFSATQPAVLGDELKTQLDIVTERIDTIYSAINNAAPTTGAPDSGAALLTSMKTALSTQVNNEDFSDILLEGLRLS